MDALSKNNKTNNTNIEILQNLLTRVKQILESVNFSLVTSVKSISYWWSANMVQEIWKKNNSNLFYLLTKIIFLENKQLKIGMI